MKLNTQPDYGVADRALCDRYFKLAVMERIGEMPKVTQELDELEAIIRAGRENYHKHMAT